MKYWIEVANWEFETTIIIDLTEKQCEFVKHLSKVTHGAADFSCMPRISVKPLSECTKIDLEEAKEVESFTGSL